jgi:hypothetical protein
MEAASSLEGNKYMSSREKKNMIRGDFYKFQIKEVKKQ